MCSYVSDHSLFLPYELLSVGGILRETGEYNVVLIDAIAESIDLREVLYRVKSHDAQFVVTMTGFECLNQDIESIRKIKEELPKLKVALIGHYASLFPKEILESCKADFIMHGEPDLKIIDLLNLINNVFKTESIESIGGISLFANDKFKQSEDVGRIKDVNALPVPDFSLIQSNSYCEPLLPKPFGVIQSARGCPYQCNFCVKSYGSKLTEKSPERIIDEIEALIQHHGIKSFRFTDDTFTLNKKRVIEICKLMIEHSLNYLEWTCLSRTDNISKELLLWMKKAGCRRIYFGIESGSPSILKKLNKKINKEDAVEALLMTRNAGIETSGFFMIGVPGETKEDIDLSVDLAIKGKIDFISIGKFTPYPGTAAFDDFQHDIEFNIYPHKLVLHNELNEKYNEFEKYFMKKFYLRASYISRQFGKALSHPKESVALFSDFLNYSFGNGKNTITHIQEISSE